MQPTVVQLTTNISVYVGRYRFEFREMFGNVVSYSQIVANCIGTRSRSEFDKEVKDRITHQLQFMLNNSLTEIDISLEQNRIEIVRKMGFSVSVLPITLSNGVELTVHLYPLEQPVARNS